MRQNRSADIWFACCPSQLSSSAGCCQAASIAPRSGGTPLGMGTLTGTTLSPQPIGRPEAPPSPTFTPRWATALHLLCDDIAEPDQGLNIRVVEDVRPDFAGVRGQRCLEGLDGFAGWRQLPWLVDDNYLGRLKAYAGQVREAGLL